MLKEPFATSKWQQTGFWKECAQGKFKDNSDAFAEAMFKSLQVVLQACDGCPNRGEVDNLSRQGTARFTCVASSCRCIGVIAEASRALAPTQSSTTGKRKVSSTTESPAVVKLGKTKRAYHFADATVLRSLAKACEQVQETWSTVFSSTNLIEVVETMHAVLHRVSIDCPNTIPTRGEDAYVRTFTVRKVAIACAVHHNMQMDWEQITLEQLKRMAPDENKFLNFFPERWSAQQVSSMVFDRPD